MSGPRSTDHLVSVVLCFTVIHLNQNIVDSHPQCLDFRAPFQVTTGLSFCSQNYSHYGCCAPARDEEIAKKAKDLEQRYNLTARPKCANMVRTILCLECHKYAAHIFAAESNKNFDSATAAPGLCPDFCKAFYRDCFDVASEFPRLAGWELRSVSPNATSPAPISYPLTEKTLCDGLQLQDTDYCYPNVETVDENILAR